MLGGAVSVCHSRFELRGVDNTKLEVFFNIGFACFFFWLSTKIASIPNWGRKGKDFLSPKN